MPTISHVNDVTYTPLYHVTCLLRQQCCDFAIGLCGKAMCAWLYLSSVRRAYRPSARI